MFLSICLLKFSEFSATCELHSFKNKQSVRVCPSGKNCQVCSHINHTCSNTNVARTEAGASILGGMGGTRPPQFLEWGGRISNCPPHFFICSMKFNSKLFSVYCGHCLSLSILLNIIQIQTRSHMLTQSCFFSNFLRCYCLIIESR